MVSQEEAKTTLFEIKVIELKLKLNINMSEKDDKYDFKNTFL